MKASRIVLIGGWLLTLGFLSPGKAWPQEALPSPPEEKYEQLDKIISLFYNYYDQVDKNREAKEKTGKLIAKYPDDPYFYDFWATIEWVLLGHELGVKLGERKNIDGDDRYRERIIFFRETINKGLALTKGQAGSRLLFAQASLWLNQARFSYSYAGGLIQADQESAYGFAALRTILGELEDFCPAYFPLGLTRFKFSKENFFGRLFIKGFSKSYEGISLLNVRVMNSNEAMQWMEKTYQCGYQEIWFKENWVESSFALLSVYEQYRSDLDDDGLKLSWLKEKELPLTKKLLDLFPENTALAKRLKEKEKLAQDYLSKLKLN